MDMDIIISRDIQIIQEAITGDTKMHRWEDIQTDEMGLKRLLLYLDSSLNSEYDFNRACDIKNLRYDQVVNRYILTVTQNFEGSGFTTRMEETLREIRIN